jgi:O-antigen/teichoic acid export membrane protein
MIRFPGLGRLVGGASAAERSAFNAVAKNSAWALAAGGVVAVALLVETVLLAHYLGPAKFGTLVLIIAFPEAVQQLLDFKVRDAMTRYLAGFIATDRKREAVAIIKLLWLIDVGVAAIAFIFVLATAGFASRLLIDDGSFGHLMQIYALGLFFSSLDTASGPVLRVLDRFRLSFVAGSASAVLRVSLVAAVVIAEGSLTQIVWARTIANILSTIFQGGVSLYVLLPLVRRELRAPIAVLRGQLREIAGFLANTNVASSLSLASSKLDKILVGLLAPPSTVALYKVATQFATAPQLASDALDTAVYPAFAGAFAKDRKEEVRHVALRTTIVLAGFMIPVGIGMAAGSEFLMDLLAGEAFRGAAAPFAICLTGVIPYVIFFWLRPLFLTTGHAGALVRMVSAGTVLQFVGLILLVPAIGVTGAAVAFALRYLLVVLLELQFASKRKLLHVAPLPSPVLSGMKV